MKSISRDKPLDMMEPENLSSEESDVDEDGNGFFKVRRLRWQRTKGSPRGGPQRSTDTQHQGQLKKREVMERFSSRGAPGDCLKFVRRK